MNDFLLEHNIITGLIWEPEKAEDHGRNYQQWLNKIRRTHSHLVYTTLNGGLLKAYAERKFSESEPLAIHVKNEFSDGIYYFCDENSESIYFLAIIDDRVLSGSDKFVTKHFFNELITKREGSQLEGLPIEELTREWLEGIAASCLQRRIVMKRKQKLFAIGVAVSAIFLVVLVAVFLNSMLS